MEPILNKLGMDNFIVLLFALMGFLFIGVINFVLIKNNLKNFKRLRDLLFAYRFKLIAFGFALSFISIGIILLSYFTVSPQIIYSNPSTAGNWDNYNEPITVKFNVPIEVSALEPKLSPEFRGHWDWEGFFGSTTLVTGGKFYPEETLFPNQRIVIYFVGAKRFNVDENNEMTLNFFAPKPTEIKAMQPANGTDNVKRDQPITLAFDKINYYLNDWSVDIQPKVKILSVNPFSDTISIKAQDGFSSDVEYKITLARKPIQYDLSTKSVIQEGDQDFIYEAKFKTAKEPLVDTFTPQGQNARADLPISVKFTLPMDRQSVENSFSLTPQTTGTFNWKDDQSFDFVPTTQFTKGITYRVRFSKGMKSQVEDSTTQDIEYTFDTVGIVKVVAFDPAGGSLNVNEKTVFKVNFNQEVDKSSAQNSFAISPGVGGKFSWSGNTMIYTPSSSLKYEATYKLTVIPGVKSVYGIDSTDPYVSSFRIRSNQVIITGVPQIYQPNGSFSCNIYAALIALSWKGKPSNAVQLISEMGHDAGMVNGQWTGDPYKEYVGNADGSWGYGVYWGPIQGVFSRRGITTELRQGWNIYSLAQTILAGHPVVIWRYNGESANYDKNWVASDGVYVHGINGQHGGVVIGFRGPTNAPTSFLLNDPWYGQVWYSSSFFDYAWSRMNRTALIVH